MQSRICYLCALPTAQWAILSDVPVCFFCMEVHFPEKVKREPKPEIKLPEMSFIPDFNPLEEDLDWDDTTPVLWGGQNGRQGKS